MIVIRDAVMADLSDMVALYNHYVLSSTATFDTEAQSLEQRTLWFKQHQSDYPLLAALEGDRLVGYVSLSPFRPKGAYRPTAELSIYVHPAEHGRGIGTQLMQAIMDRARTGGYHTIVSVIVGQNEASVKLHRKCGFTLVGHLHEVGFKLGAWHDIFYYQRLLPSPSQGDGRLPD